MIIALWRLGITFATVLFVFALLALLPQHLPTAVLTPIGIIWGYLRGLDNVLPMHELLVALSAQFTIWAAFVSVYVGLKVARMIAPTV